MFDFLKCSICDRKLQNNGFTFFSIGKIRETYETYRCNFNHTIKILQNTESIDKHGSNKRYHIESEKTDKLCPICCGKLNHISDDVRTDPDWIFHYNRYVCNKNSKHRIRIMIERTHNNEETWKNFDMKTFGYDNSLKLIY